MSEGQRALRGLERGEGEAAEQGAHDGAGEIDRQQRHLRGRAASVRDRRIAFREPARVGDQPGGEQDGEVGGGGGEPALAEPVVEAGGDFDGRGDGQEDEGERQDVVGGDSSAALVPSPARVAMVATISRSLRQETASPKRVKTEQDEAGGPGGDGVEAEGGFPEQRAQDEHGGEAVERGFEAARRRGARGPDQPQEA